MDYNIYIIIPSKKIHELNIIEKKANWLGEFFSYDPRTFVFNNELELFVTKYPFKSNKHNKMKKNMTVFKIPKGVRELEIKINKSHNIEDNCIFRLLQQVIKTDESSILIFEDDMLIDKEIIIHDVNNELLMILKYVFNWDDPQNVEIRLDTCPPYCVKGSDPSL